MAKLLRMETISVKDMIEKVKNNEWKFDTTTQRQFIYNSTDLKKVPTDSGSISKAGYVIYNIFERQTILPSITLWYNTDTKEYNIHDGKQRVLSLYYFITTNCITTYIHGKPITNFNALSEEDQNTLLNYTLGIQINEGTTDEEKENFYEVNSNAINLTDYENLRSVSFGPYIYSFEEYIDTASTYLDSIKKVGRGEQAYKLLLAHFDINDSKQTGTIDTSKKKLRDAVAKLINTKFNPEDNKFNLFIETFNSLSNINFQGSSKKLPEDIAIAIAKYIIRNYPQRVNDVIELYRRNGKQRNDIVTWASDFNKDNLQTHKCFIKAYLDEGLELDPRRYFDDSEKEAVIKRDGCRCAYRDAATGEQCTETGYHKLEMDHIIPWSKGGRTSIDNAQLLCKTHNISKGAR